MQKLQASVTRQYFPIVLRQFRHQARLSQEALAERVGVSVGFVGMMEVGRRWPNIDMLFRIAAALGVKPSSLIEAIELLISRDAS
jgi:transcriptional regulator with XRE-family HTH domain